MFFQERILTATIEVMIQKLLSEKDTAAVADELMKMWNSGSLSITDKDQVVHFLISSGYHTTLKNKLIEEISKNTPLNWKGILFFLSQIPINDTQADSIFVGLTEDLALDKILNFKGIQQQNKRFEKVYTDLTQEKMNNKQGELSQALTRLKLAISDKDQAEVNRISEELKKRFSYSEEVRDIALDVDLAKAKKILKRKEQELELNPLKDLNDTSYRTKEFQGMAKSYLAKAKKDKSQAYNLAISLFQMDAFSEALEVLELSPDTEPKDWFKIELLIINKRYIEALQFSFSLETKYLKNPDTIYETLYFRSLALYELNDKETAKHILEKIISSKPEHMKSRIKLSEWKDTV